LDRNELGGRLVQSKLGSPRDHALVSLPAMNALRITAAADIDDFDIDRGHRTLRVVRKGGKHVHRSTRTAYIGERATGPTFLGTAGSRIDRYAADRR
jgi:hypothetical protein